MNNIAIWILGLIFFVVGALFCMNDVIFPYVKTYYELNYFQTSLIQWTFYLVYLPFPFLVSRFVNKNGYKLATICAIIITIIGCFIFYPSYSFSSFTVLLLSIAIISTGIMVINVAANPYAALLGSTEQSQLRINFVQVFSRIGYAFTPTIGNYLVKPTTENANPTIFLPYLILASIFILILLVMFFVNMPSFKPENSSELGFIETLKKSYKYPHLFWGAVTMFFYVGIEACTASYFISYFIDGKLKLDIDSASSYLSWYNILAGIGGFIGIYILKFLSGNKLITYLSIVLMIHYFLVSSQFISHPFVLISIGLFIAPMFPTIYGLAIDKLGDFTIHGAALVSFAIVGGAIFPPLQGVLADQFGVATSYFIPMLCILAILLYGLFYQKLIIKHRL